LLHAASGRSSRGDLRERVGSSDQSGGGPGGPGGGGGGGGSESTLSPAPGPPPPVPFSIPNYPPGRFLDDNAV
jgi:hypothetical protein